MVLLVFLKIFWMFFVDVGVIKRMFIKVDKMMMCIKDEWEL